MERAERAERDRLLDASPSSSSAGCISSRRRPPPSQHHAASPSAPPASSNIIAALPTAAAGKPARCTYCERADHTMQTCREWAAARRGVSQRDYISMSGSAGLEERDRLGCTVAAMLPVICPDGGSEPLVLLWKADSRGQVELRFIGGRRQSRAQHPWQIASGQFIAHTSGEAVFNAAAIHSIRSIDSSPVFFSSSSKYALFACRLPAHCSKVDWLEAAVEAGGTARLGLEMREKSWLELVPLLIRSRLCLSLLLLLHRSPLTLYFRFLIPSSLLPVHSGLAAVGTAVAVVTS
jgi:hypothetical protein